MKKNQFSKKVMSIALCCALLLSYIPLTTSAAAPLSETATIVTDNGTAHTWESMMGTPTDGNRYAGRVWADKSVYKDGDTVLLNTQGNSSSSFRATLEEDEAFQIVFSALGSSMTTTTTTSSTGPMDVVLILDNSVSMNTVSNGTTRMQKVIEAANKLLDELMSQNNDVRLGITAYSQDASTVLPFGTYTNGVSLRVNNYSSGGVITAYDKSNQRINSRYQSNGYANYTNTQAGFDLAMEMLEGATNTANRKPVVILLTDGAANTAVDTLFTSGTNGTVRQVYYSNNIDPMIALSTLLSAAYNKVSVEKHYGRAPMIYGIGVDLSSADGSNAIIDPKNNFNISNNNSNIRSAYNTYTNTWLDGENVSVTSGTGSGWGSSNYTFRFGHSYPNSAITDADIAANINYVDTYYPVAGANLETVFDQIYQELSSGVFNPISSTTTVEGGTGAQDTPLIYVDFIGQYMEIKEIQSISLFGASYNVLKDASGDYTVQTATGINPTTNESWNTSRDIRIRVTKTNGIQKLEIKINQQILPILLEKVDDRNINGEHNATITEISQEPLRIFYTVGLASDILLPNGEIDVSAISSSYGHISGNEISFYSNQFGVTNPTADNGNAHIGFKPSGENRYYYHQSNHDIFTAVSRKDGTAINWQADEYGVLYQENTFNFTWLTYNDYNSLQAGDQVYTYVTYYRPIAANSSVAEEVTYLVYTDWAYLKDSVSFYDHNAETYINYHENSSFVTGDVGYAIPSDKVAATIDAYKQANPNAEIYGMLGVESLRTSRLHNMIVAKDANPTGTDVNYFSPEYTHQTAAIHSGNDVVIWLGNNGKLTTTIDTGIALTKRVTETIGNANDTYALTVTVPAGVSATPVVKDSRGNNVTASVSSYANNVLTVNVKANETVYISGIPAGTVCQIGESIPAGKDYYVSSKTDTVTIPSLSEVLNGAAQFAPATVTNAPNKYGDLTIIKDISHNLSTIPADMQNKVFTFKVELPVALAGKTYQVDKANASLFADTQITVGADGSFTVELKDNESITIMDLPAGTAYTVSETSLVAGYQNAAAISGTVEPDGDHDAHFVNTYVTTPIKPAITITGTKTLVDTNNTYSANEDFTFVLSQYVSGSYVDLATATAKAGSSYSFQLADVLSAPLDIGEYYFRITEQAGATPGMSYDATRGLFKVTVTDSDADGALEFTVADAGNTTVSGNTVTKDFTNTYNVSRTHADINITKVLENNTGVNLPLNMFHFEQVNTGKPDTDPAIANKTVTTDASGKATIRVSDLGPGVYTFTLTEQDGGMPGMTYDTVSRNVTITITEESGALVAVTQIDGVATNEVTFRNTYALTAASHTISGTKQLTGKDIANGEFSFALYETDSSFVLAGGATAKQTVTNTGNSFSFDAISYNKVGTYYYSIKEVNKGQAGITYDTTHYHVTVTVGVNGAALEVTGVSINKIGHNDDTSGQIAFVNSYTATPTEYAISGTKVLNGRALAPGEFTFGLYHEGALLSTATNKADGSFTFEAIDYSKPGTYTYTVKEIVPADADKLPGITYSTEEVEVTVTVTDTNAVLSASANKTAVQTVITNSYSASAARVSFNGTKTLVGAALADNAFTFNLYQTDSSFDITASTANLRASDKNVSGKFGFSQSLAQPGTYFFVIAEDTADTSAKVVYDRTQHKFIVQVNDIGDGQLRAFVTNAATGVSGTEGASVSASVAFTNATADAATEKEVYLAGDTSTEVDGKKVYAGDILTYYITYTNYNGEDVVVDIMDAVPANTSYVDGSATLGGNYAATHVNWILHVAKGDSVTVSFKVKVDQPNALITNTAIVRDGYNEYITNEVTNHTTENTLKKDVVQSSAPTVSVDGKKVHVGDELAYVLTYTNNGDATMEQVTITDTIPAGTALVEGSVSNSGVVADGTITWNFTNVPAGASLKVSFMVKVTAAYTELKNKATAVDTKGSYSSNETVNPAVKNEFTKNVSLSSAPTVSMDGKQVATGDILIYTITYRNNTDEAVNVTITDTLSKFTAYVEGSADNGGLHTNGTLAWTLTLAAGESKTVSFKALVTGTAATVENQAKAVDGRNEFVTNVVTNTIPNASATPATPQTGDEMNLVLWMSLLLASFVAMTSMVIFRKRFMD